MPDRSDRDRLLDILDEIAVIERALDGFTFDRFKQDEIVQRAVLHALKTIGEAANHISEATLAKIEATPWPQIRGMRNRIVHGYFGIDLKAIWLTATLEAPLLRDSIADSGLI